MMQIRSGFSTCFTPMAATDGAVTDLGSAELVEERKIETDKWVFIEGCKNPKAVTILRGASQRVVDEAERSVYEALLHNSLIPSYFIYPSTSS